MSGPGDDLLADLLGVDPRELHDGAPRPSLRRGRIGDSCPFAQHEAVIDKGARRVRCARCRADLDPFEVLHGIAVQFEWYAGLVAEGNRLEREIEALKAAHAKLRAAVKRTAEAACTQGVLPLTGET